MRVVNGGRHHRLGFGSGIAEHQALIAGTLFFGFFLLLFVAVDALGDIRRLLADQIEHAAGGAVEADGGAVVADVGDHLAGQRFQVDPGAGGDLAGDDRHAGLHQGFAGHARARILGQDGIQHGVGNLVGDLVRMPFGDRFGGKQITAHFG